MNEFITVYSAEMSRRLKSRAFRIGLIVGLAGVILFIKLPALLGGAFDTNGKTIVLSGDPALTARARTLLKKDFSIVGTSTQTSPPDPAFMKAHQDAGADVILARIKTGLRATVYARDPGNMDSTRLRRDLLPLNLQLATSLTQSRISSLLEMPVDIRTVASKFGSAAEADAARAVAYTLIFFLYFLILFNSQLLMSSVAEEKTSRIAELLVASIDPLALLYGKIAAAATLAIVQMVIWVVTAALLGGGASSGGAEAAAAPSSGALSGLGVIPPFELAGFFIFFILGYLQLAMLFASAGSLISRTEDLGSVSGPLIIPVIGALFIAIAALGFPDAPWIVGASLVPLIAPFVMFARIAVSNVPVWQVALSLVINVAAVWVISILAGRLYRVGMLLYGRTPKLRQVWATIRG